MLQGGKTKGWEGGIRGMVGWADRELWQYGGLWPVQCMAGRGDQNPHNRTPGPATSPVFNAAGFTQERQ